MKKKKLEQEFIVAANRMKRLPPYLFTIMDDLKAQARAAGKDVIDLGMGSPDIPPPPHVIEAMSEAVHRKEVHGYSRAGGEIEKQFRRAIAAWYEKKFNVVLNPDKEVLPLIGAKEGVAHLSLALLNPDDIALVPSPAYPVHFNGVIMAGGLLFQMPLRAENNYLPQLNKVDTHILRQSKLMILGYPHNPTTAIADAGFFQDVVDYCRKNHIILAHDLAYSDFVRDPKHAPSILQADGARDVAIEFHTFSKSYCMAGWRLAFAVGNERVLALLAKTKSYIDFGIFPAAQLAGVAALSGPQDYMEKTVKTYLDRTDFFVRGLNQIGWDVPQPKSTFYIWAHLPLKFSTLNSLEFASLLVKEAGVGSAPGTGFGEYGEGYVRFATVQPEARLKEALRRIQKVLHMATS